MMSLSAYWTSPSSAQKGLELLLALDHKGGKLFAAHPGGAEHILLKYFSFQAALSAMRFITFS